MFKNILFVCMFLIAASVHAEIIAGVSKVDITPELSNSPALAGYNIIRQRIPTEVHQKLYATALYLKIETQEIAFVSIDLLGMSRDSLSLAIEKFNFPVIIGFTHTHSAPDTIGIWSRSNVDEYIKRVNTSIIQSILEAKMRYEPVKLSFASTEVNGLNNDMRVPFCYDNVMSLMQVKDKSNSVISTVVNWSAHPGCFKSTSTKISSDYPGALTSMMDKEFGGTSLYFNGPVGGQILAVSCWHKTPQGIVSLPLVIKDPDSGEIAPEHGKKRIEILAKCLMKHVKSAVFEEYESKDIRFAKREFSLPVNNIYFAIVYDILGIKTRHKFVPTKYASINFINKIFVLFALFIFKICSLYLFISLWRKKDRKLSFALWLLSFMVLVITIRMYLNLMSYVYETQSEVNYLKLGNVAEFITVPGELYPELSVGISEKPDIDCDYGNEPYETPIKSIITAKHKFIIGICNDEIGYIIPKCLWDEKWPYAYYRKGMSSPQYDEINSLGPDTAGIIISNVKKVAR